MSDIRVQRGRTDVANTDGTATLGTPVSSTTSAFVLNRNNRKMNAGRADESTGTLAADDLSVLCELTSTSTVSFDRQAGSLANPMRVDWEVWEYVGAPGGVNEFIVRGQQTITLAGVQSGTATISGIATIDRCVPFITGISTVAGSARADLGTAIAWMSGADTLNVDRGSGADSTVAVSVTVVEFTGSAWSIGHGRQEGSGTDAGTVNLVNGADGLSGGTFTVSDWGTAIIDHQYRASTLVASNVALADHWPVITPGNSTTVGWQFDANHDDTAGAGNREIVLVHVIQNDGLAVTRYTDTQSLTGTMPISISSAGLSDIAHASIDVTRRSSGSGTAYGRNWVNARITSTTTAELWCHRSGNTISSTVNVYDFAGLSAVQVTSINSGSGVLAESGTNTITGAGFLAIQGAGSVVISQNSDGSGASSTQSIVSWSDTSIEFSFVRGSLTDGRVYVQVINNDVAGSARKSIRLGPITFSDYVTDLAPDHWWTLDGDFNDTGLGPNNRPMTQGVSGAGLFSSPPVDNANTQCWEITSTTEVREVADSTEINSDTEVARTMGGWLRMGGVPQPLSCIYKEGGSVNNMAFLIGFGNVLVAQYADTGDDNVQAYSDLPLAANRDYHILFRFDHGESPAEFRLFIDGVEQSVTDGNPMTSGNLDAHSGDVGWGLPDGSLEMGGTDISFQGPESAFLSNWMTWTRGLDKVTEIPDLFILGARPVRTIATGTEAAMQAALDAFASSALPDEALSMQIDTVSGGGALTLVLDGIEFNERTSIQIRYTGSGVCTLINRGSSNVDAAKVSATNGGSVVVINEVAVTVVAQDLADAAAGIDTPVVGARVRLIASGGGPIADDTVIGSGATDGAGAFTALVQITADQSFTGVVRKGGTVQPYKPTQVSGTATPSAGSSQVVLLQADE